MRLPLIVLSLLLCSAGTVGQSAKCEIKNYHKVIQLSGNTLVEQTEVELQINSAKGLAEAEIKILYSKGNVVKDLQAVVYDSNGQQIRKLKNRDIVRSNAFSYEAFHSDDMLLSFKLLHNSYPYIIKYSYRKQADDYLFLAYWLPRLKKDIPVRRASLTLNVPDGLPLNVFQQSIQSPDVKVIGPERVYHWEAENIEVVEREKFGPQWQELQAQVVVMPADFHYGVDGNGRSWQQFGKWLTQLKENSQSLTLEEQNRIRQITEDCESDREKIDKLYKYLQTNTRYINVALDIGGLKPEPASYVCANKYGDCKALTNYMQAMLSELGIHSVYTVVHAGHHPKHIKKAYPSQQFNHVILCVPQANDTIWLECTDNSAPFNYLGTFTQNRTVLLVDGEQSRLAQTPALQVADVANSYRTQISQDAAGVWQASTFARLRGRAFDSLKSLNDGLPQRDKLDYIEKLSLIEYADIQDFELNRASVDSSVIDLSLQANLVNAIEPIGNRALLKPVRPFYFNLETPEKRTQELRFNYPFNVHDTVIYKMPKAIKKLSGIKGQRLTSRFGSYQREVHIEGNTLVISRHLVIKAGVYELDEYELLYSFIKTFGNAELEKGIIEYL
ncbi:DUF3857 domain-containing protein [Carboxylicivirga taeanensis]|uniref:DUF3857 domain-containing protein n=1 Tax=Carboxylicivirga taeanensis TaxID=1416875 RepID=UPI003F6E26E8